MKKILKTIILLTSLLIISSIDIYAQSKPESEEPINRKKIHLYFGTFLYSKVTANFLYGVTNNLYLGVSFRPGEKAENNEFLGSINSRGFEFYDYKKSNFNNFFNLKSQYFFLGNFYTSLDLGMRTGFEEKITKYTIAQVNSLEILPFTKTTFVSDRYSMLLGIGYRKEFFEHFLLGSEIQYGILSGAKVNKHYNFNPTAYNGLPNDIILDQLLNDSNDYKTRRLMIISIYAGIAF
ncbi:hypothetical protein [Leptospira levettii]|uniref:Outer membrane protein beta-barrel domain-containing protein n=2 Tax=Leptospira levettii TaxID=2023178 RepID=A0ABY2MJU1_9LEPT|nr:hypothetical protein [Leptospira levettii]PKA22575.1 hypothetical protein CH381_30205 [Leptospira sp. mixed culture ATI2-C-A1]TGL66513.1 hypothetical protein EHQ60_18690 [Leptospira levettii]TGM26159.1 hypothetical protein EHQ74_11225 [Leptospira levettii]